MEQCAPILAGVAGACIDGFLYSLVSTKRAFEPYLCGSSGHHTSGYSALSQNEQERLLDEEEQDSEDEEEHHRQRLVQQERDWSLQARGGKASKVLGINSKARQVLGLAATREPSQEPEATASP